MEVLLSLFLLWDGVYENLKEPAAYNLIYRKEETPYECGLASWYGPYFDGRQTANQEVFDMDAMTAAHPSLPFNTVVTVKTEQGSEVKVRINDRGPYVRPRIIDLSARAAEELGIKERGVQSVCVYIEDK